MTFRFFTPFLSAFLAFFSFNLNAQGFGVVIDSVEAQPGQIVCLPVRAHGFEDIISYQYSLSWDPQVLAFHHTQGYNLPNLLESDFNEYPDDILLAAWSSPTGFGVNRINGETLYEVCYTVTGGVGSSTAISIGSIFPPSVGPAEAYNFGNQDVWAPLLNVFGFVEVVLASSTTEVNATAKPHFRLLPNPTHFTAQVVIQSPVSGEAMLFVSDMLGKTVLEENAKVILGENTFEIPANVLAAKGLYQVSLKTEQGVSSQILSVY